MSEKFDIALFGGSGVTGQYVIEELSCHTENVKWCVAARNPDKMRLILKKLGELIGKDLSEIVIVQADAQESDSLIEMCKQTKLVINCVGPYRFSGEAVVKACMQTSVHCIDVSGEPQFLECMQLKYFKEAEDKHIYIVGSCGFDSIPCDVGVEYLRKNFNGDLESVETYMSARQPPGSTVNFGTWQSAIYGLAHGKELKPLRKALKETVFTKPLPKPNYPLPKRGMLFDSQEAGGWCIPFIGSDRSVVIRSQMYNFQFKNQRPVQIQTYMKTRSFFHALITLMMGAVFMIFTKFAFGRTLLEKYPELFSLGVFSKTPPPREQTGEGSFKIRLVGHGWSEKLDELTDQHVSPPCKTVKALIVGPDPAYITTAICVVNSALVILAETTDLPNSGGVLTPGVAFSNTTLIQRLQARGIQFQILNEGQ